MTSSTCDRHNHTTTALRQTNKHWIETQTNIKFSIFFPIPIFDCSLPWQTIQLPFHPHFPGQNNYKNESNQWENHLATPPIQLAPPAFPHFRLFVYVYGIQNPNPDPNHVLWPSLKWGSGMKIGGIGVLRPFFMPRQTCGHFPIFCFCIFTLKFMAFIWQHRRLVFSHPQITNWLKTCLGRQIILLIFLAATGCCWIKYGPVQNKFYDLCQHKINWNR